MMISSEEHVHGPNCGCAHKKPPSPALIEDPDDLPPDTCDKGFPRYIPDPESIKPSYWDEDDDGPWEADLIENPAYTWKPRMIPNPEYKPPPQTAYRTKFIAEVHEAMPWVLLGILLVSLFSLVPLPMDFLQSHLSGTGLLSSVKAGILGLATPLCSCGSLPIAAGLLGHGVPLSSVVTFLTASQSAGLDSAMITYGLLGPTAALGRLIGALVLAVVAGSVLQFSFSGARKYSNTENKQSVKTFKENKIEESSDISNFISKLIDTTMDIFPLVLIGLAISTTAIHYIPNLTAPLQATKQLQFLGDFILRLAVIISALPLQLCEHTTAAIAAGIQKSGGGAGLAFAFLLSAPATNLPSLLLLAKAASNSSSYSRFTPLKISLALSIAALLMSYCVDIIEIDLLVEKEAEIDNEMAALPSLFVKASPYVLGTLLICGSLRTIKRKLFAKGGSDDECCATTTACEKKLN